jgi:hypothetical protein
MAYLNQRTTCPLWNPERLTLVEKPHSPSFPATRPLPSSSTLRKLAAAMKKQASDSIHSGLHARVVDTVTDLHVKIFSHPTADKSRFHERFIDSENSKTTREPPKSAPPPHGLTFTLNNSPHPASSQLQYIRQRTSPQQDSEGTLPFVPDSRLADRPLSAIPLSR